MSSPLESNQSQQLSLTATEAVSAIATGRLSAETYVRTLLARASSLSNLHAFITLNQGAIASARAVDAARAAGQMLPALAGLPIKVERLRTLDDEQVSV